jgi:hypothetical protein
MRRKNEMKDFNARNDEQELEFQRKKHQRELLKHEQELGIKRPRIDDEPVATKAKEIFFFNLTAISLAK